jgi:restriction system protein
MVSGEATLTSLLHLLTDDVNFLMRRSQSDSQVIAEILVTLPPWATAILGVIVYFVIQWLPNAFTGMWHDAAVGAAPQVGYMALCVFGVAALLGALKRWLKRRLLDQQSGPTSLRSMDPKGFELLVAAAFERQGFAVDCSIHNGPDGGVDVVLKKNGRISLVQCKRWWTTSVGVDVVREMLGLLHHHGADEVIVVTTGEFTEEAKAFAQGKAMQLINGPKLWEMVKGVQRSSPKEEAAPSSPSQSVPACPSCGSAMTLRLAKKGAKAGQKFWGCSGYPLCTGTRDL